MSFFEVFMKFGLGMYVLLGVVAAGLSVIVYILITGAAHLHQ